MVKGKGLLESYFFPIILIIGIGIGCILGVIMGKDALIFKPLGDIFIYS